MNLTPITIKPDPVAEQAVQDYIAEYDSTYQWRHVRNICVTQHFTGVPPFRDFCGIIYHPDGGLIIFCDTLAKGYRNWIRRHPEVQCVYNNGQCSQYIPSTRLPSLNVTDNTRAESFERHQALKPTILSQLLEAGNTKELIAQLFNTDLETINYISKKPVPRKLSGKKHLTSDDDSV